MLRKHLLFLLFISCFHISNAQYISAYEDNRNYFYVFENGFPRQLETAPVGKYKIAGNSMLYVNNANELRVWYAGQKLEIGEAANTNLFASANLLYYTCINTLSVIEKGNPIILSYFLREYKAGDNIIAFKDDRLEVLKVYYNGTIHEIEYTLASDLNKFDVGYNTMAFTNGSHEFKVFCEGEIYELATWEPDQFLCGKDMVAFIDGGSKQFNLFYKDKIIKLENFSPLSMQMGHSVLAYVSDENALKVFQNGKLLKLEAFEPDFYKVKDDLLVFYCNQRFQVINNGVRYELENAPPRSYVVSRNYMAYLDNAGRLKFFDNGKTNLVTTETVDSYEVNGDVLKYYVANNTAKIYWKGKNY